MHYLKENERFPPVSTASKEGVVAIGGSLTIERLLEAYSKGIFPWYDQPRSPLIWWSPDPRMVVPPTQVKITKSMRSILNKNVFTVTFNKAFETVIIQCATIKRKDEQGTWIHPEMISAYTQLHKIGKAVSVEVWHQNDLVGGLYGVDMGHVFCGESMFASMANASKVAFIALAQNLAQKNYALIDCQLYTEHLFSLGAREVPRDYFLEILLQRPS